MQFIYLKNNQSILFNFLLRYRSSRPGLTEEATIGTTAEIYEFREPSPDSLEVGLKIKAKGRQRFRILSQRRQIDG